GAEPVIVAISVLEPGGEALHSRRRMTGEELLFLEEHVVAGVRGVDHVHVLDIRLELLHHALEDALGAGAVHLDLDAGIGRLEELGHLLRAGQRERRVPHHLALLLRGLHARRVLRRGGVSERSEEGEQRDEDREKPSHGHLLRGARDASRSDSGAPAASPPTARMTPSIFAPPRAAALPRNFASSSARLSGASGPPRGRSWRSRRTRPSASVTSTSPTNWRG